MQHFHNACRSGPSDTIQTQPAARSNRSKRLGDVNTGAVGERRTLMHASHVEADSKMRQMVKDEGFNMRALDEIENLRPCCANCNGDMRRFNMFNFLDRVGRFMDAEYRAWKDWFDNL